MAKRRTDRTHFEGLESRQMMSASPQALAAAGYEPVNFNGQQVYAKSGQWILKLDDVHGKAADQLAQVNAKLIARGLNGIKATRQLGQDGLVLLTAPKGSTHANLHATLKGLNSFAYVEPDQLITSDATSNDPYLSNEWGLNNTGQTGGAVDADMDVTEAWDLTTGSASVVVGVIDSGVAWNHPDLANNMWRNPGEIAGDGVDNDGNGYADDVYGYDFYANDSNPMDENGHGTHVAGTIAASGNNGAGVAGVSWNSKIMALRFLGADGTGSLSGAVSAINYATKMRTTYGVNVRVLNHSYGSGGYSTALFDAFKNSGTANILSLVAAGNGGADQVGDNNDSVANYPSNFNLDNVVAVAATDKYDNLASFSNFGTATVDLAAPGVDIASTYLNGQYVFMSGTSMATPNTAGVAALAFSYAPSASYQTVRNALLSGVDTKASLAGKVATGGRVNAYKTLTLLGTTTQPAPTPTPTPTITTPTAPTGLSVTQTSKNQVTLRWTDNSTNESGFYVERSANNSTWTQIGTVGANATSYKDGAKSNTRYYYRVRAFNTAGNSAYSNTAYVGGTVAGTSLATGDTTPFSTTTIRTIDELLTAQADVLA